MKKLLKGTVILSLFLFFAGVFSASVFANEGESNPDVGTVIDYVNVENNILSPNGDGKFDQVNLKVGLNKKVNLSAEVWDAMDPTGGHYGDGTIGFIIKLGSEGPGEYNFRTNGRYHMWEYPDPNLTFLMQDSVYSLHMVADAREEGNFRYEGHVDSGPILVKTSTPEIKFNPVSGARFTGKVIDKFIDYKATVENVYGENYNVNDYLTTKYELKDASSKVAKSGSLTLAQNGSFEISLSDLQNGNYTATVRVQDAAGNPERVQTQEFTVTDSKPVERIEGNTRFETAIEISQAGWGSADTVILSRFDNFADALAGVPLGYQLDAPILLTQSSKLHADTLKEIQRLGAKDVVVLGGPDAINKSVENELKAAKLNVRRIEGDNRFETAASIAEELHPNGAKDIVVANGMDFPDALSVASYSASEGVPILLTIGDRLPDATNQAIKDLGADRSIVIGGPDAVSETVRGQLPNATRWGGNDRYETNVIINKNFDADHMYVATGQNYADALTGAVLAAKYNTSILLVHHRVPASVSQFITSNKLTNLSIFGGDVAVSNQVANELEKLVK